MKILFVNDSLTKHGAQITILKYQLINQES